MKSPSRTTKTINNFIDPLETIHQQKVIRFLEMKNLDYFAVPNSGERNKRYAFRLKREGVKSGIPDIIILSLSPVKNKPVALEMKRKVARKHNTPCSCLDPEQVVWKEKFMKNGWVHVLAHGYEDAIATLQALGY